MKIIHSIISALASKIIAFTTFQLSNFLMRNLVSTRNIVAVSVVFMYTNWHFKSYKIFKTNEYLVVMFTTEAGQKWKVGNYMN